MNDFQQFIASILLWAEGFAAMTGLFYYNRIKKEHWKFFVFYLVFIFICEAIGKWANFIYFPKALFYNYFVIPVQFIFFYWLFAAKSLKKPKLFYILSILYLISYIISELYFSKKKIVFSFNYTFGCLLLMFLVAMEYYKQVNSTDILNFSRNRMFYISLGITISYIGTLPFFALYDQLYKYQGLWNIYFDYFLLGNVVMYILFSSSFIWGRQSS
ncbi:hypothetical protein VUJ46_18045 [Chryseobacterium sp. MYb264]|uniref:hypothetical protein n=1 Tax=Chryseobacterium sp. MYb264 TaxID=2745153 RepID=UPI002E148852|nr:hypothetical protein VUJ46_18045 [Chryseobacterium sp. MYb264]